MIKIIFTTVGTLSTISGMWLTSSSSLIIGAVYLVGAAILHRLDNLVLVEAKRDEPTN